LNTDPIDELAAGFNLPAPAIISNHHGLAASYNFNDHMLLVLADTHGFENSISGPIQTPMGPVPGSDVEATMSSDSIVIGVRTAF